MPANSHRPTVAAGLRRAEQLCREKNLRLTPLRKTVLRMILKNKTPTKAYDLIAAIGGKTTPTTVYRALDFLLHSRLIHRINSLNAYFGCSHPPPGHDCYFLLCARCGAADECCSARLADSVARTIADNKFAAHSVALEIIGLCRACQR